MNGEWTAFLSACCYAMSYVFLKRGQAESRPPDSGLLPVLLISSPILLLGLVVRFAAGRTLLGSLPALAHSAILVCILSGLVGTLFGRLTLFVAIDGLGPTRTTVIKTTETFITVLIGIFVLDESFADTSVWGILLLATGVGLLMWEARQVRGVNTRLAIALGFAAAGLQGAGHFLRKLSVMQGVDAATAATTDVLAATLGYLLLLLLTGKLGTYLHHYKAHWNLYLALSGMFSAGGVLLFFRAVATTPVSTVAIIMATQPVLVAVWSAILLRRIEKLTWLTGLCAILVSAGIVLMSLD